MVREARGDSGHQVVRDVGGRAAVAGSMHARVLVAGALLLSACSPNDAEETPADAPSTTVFVSQGSGSENEEPLWPLHPGYTTSLVHRGIDGLAHPPVAFQGKTLIPWEGDMAHLHTVGFDTQSAPQEPVPVAYMSNSDAGLLLHGFTRDGLWPSPALFLPNKVRVGMSWTVGVRGKPRFTFTVESATQKATRFGNKRVWTLRIGDAEGKHGLPSGVTHGATATMTFIEGRGLETAIVVPLEEPPLPMPTRVPIRKLNEGKPIGGPMALSMVAASSPKIHGRGLVLAISGLAAHVDNLDYGPAKVTIVRATGCGRYQPDASPSFVESDECVGGLDTVIQANGFAYSIVGGYDEKTCRPGACQQTQQLAVYNGKDDTLYGYGYTGSTRTLTWGSYQGVGAAQTYPPSWQQFDLLEPKARLGQSQRLLESHLGEGYFSWVQPLASGEAYVPVGSEYFSYARVDAAHTELTNAHFAGFSLPTLSWKVTPEGREAYRAQPGGRIEQIRITDKGIEVVPLADLDLPPGTFIGGAVVHEGKIIAGLTENFIGNDKMFYGDNQWDAALPALGYDSYLVEADLPATPAPVVPPQLYAMLAEADASQASQFARVCIPPGSGSFAGSSFVVNGAPARALHLSQGGRCASVFYDRSGTDPQNPLPDTQVDLVTTVPGVGKVALEPSGSPSWRGRKGAPLADGALAFGGWILDEMGFVEGMLPYGNGRAVPETGFVDRAGAGYWAANPDDPTELLLIGRSVQRFPGLGAPVGAVAGGGVLVAGGLLRPGAKSPTPLPVLTLSPVELDRGGVVLADGTVCGFGANARQCVSPAGAVVTAHGPAAEEYAVRRFVVGQSSYVIGSDLEGQIRKPRLVRYDATLERPVVYGNDLLGFAGLNSWSGLPFAYTPEGDAMLWSPGALYWIKENEVLRAPLDDQGLYGLDTMLVTEHLISWGTDTKTVERASLKFVHVEPDGGLGRCTAGTHPCGAGAVTCVPDVANDPTLGCRYGCGVSCPVPQNGVATCSPEGSCGISCTPPFLLENGACVCTAGVCGTAPQTCTSFVDSCGKTLTCNTCGTGFTCDLALQQCTCPVDAREPNDSLAQATLRPAVVSAVGVSQLDTLDFALDTANDVDWTSYTVTDQSPGHLKYIIQDKLLTQPGGTTLEMTVLFQCNVAGSPAIACALGVPTTVGGVPGCKSAPAQASKDVSMTVDCPGNDASGTYYVGLASSTWEPRCGVALNVDSRLYLQ